jgi:hypothetical protein
LDLTRASRGTVDEAETGTQDCVGRKSHIHDVEYIEELSPELDVDQFASGFSPSYGRVLYNRHVEVVEGRSSKGVPPQGAKTPVIGPGSSRDIDGY